MMPNTENSKEQNHRGIGICSLIGCWAKLYLDKKASKKVQDW